MRPGSNLPSFPDYAAVRRDRPTGGGGGVLTLVHHSVRFAKLQSPINDGSTELILVKANIAGMDIFIANVYIPPQSSCPPNFSPNFSPLLVANSLIVGNVNGHNDLWSLGNADPRGNALTDELDNNNLVALNNPDIATRPSSNSSLDVSFASSSIALNFDWSTFTTLNSDHLPITICIEDDFPATRPIRTFINLRKANWDGFKRDIEAEFARIPLPTSCSVSEKEWRRVISKASARNIPAGFWRSYIPGLENKSSCIVAERDEI